tara:strand:+ start:289 stop:456 length:168 start_codon:yes stop_codon:yes gene_type:complete
MRASARTAGARPTEHHAWFDTGEAGQADSVALSLQGAEVLDRQGVHLRCPVSRDT